MVQLHRPGSHRRDVHGQLPGSVTVRDHRRAAHRQLVRPEPDRRGRRPEHRRLPDLDHGHRQHHAAGRPADADRRPGLQRLELPLHGLHPGLQRRRGRGRGRHRPDRVLRHAGPRTGPADHGLLDPGRHRLPGARRHRRRPRHPLVQPVSRPAVAGRRPRLRAADLQREHPLGGRVRLGLPGPGVQRQRDLDQHLLHDDRYRRDHEVHRVRDRPLYPRLRHRPGHPVRRLDLRVRRLRADHHRAGHRRQRQRRQRGLPLGGLHRAGRPAGPAGAQHHGPGRRGHPGLRRRHLGLHRPGQRHPQPVHQVAEHGGRPVRSRRRQRRRDRLPRRRERGRNLGPDADRAGRRGQGRRVRGQGREHLARPDNQPGARPALGPDLRDLRRGPVPGRPDHLGRGARACRARA